MSAAASLINGASHLSAFAADLPDPDPVQPPGTSNVTTVLGWAKWVCFFLCSVGVIGVAARLAISNRRGEIEDHAKGLAAVLFAAILCGIGGSLIAALQ